MVLGKLLGFDQAAEQLDRLGHIARRSIATLVSSSFT
jgi:hypothetical protein